MAISDELTKLDAVRDALISSVNNKGGSLAVDSTLWQIKAGIDAIQQDSGGSSDCDHPAAVQPSPTVAIDKTTGKITAEYTPVAGLVTDTGKKSAELQLTTQAAQTITPGTSNKTIAADRYLTGVQTIAGDANLTAGNIKKGVSIFNVTGEYEGEGGGGGGAFDLVKVTEYTPAQAAFTGVSAVTFSGFGYDEMTGEDYSVLNGTFAVENETEPDPLKRTFKLGSYYLYYYPDPDGMNGGSAWCIAQDKSSGGYSAWLYYNTESELASGTINWYSSMGSSATSTAAVTTANYPEQSLSLKGQKATAYDPASKVWTFSSAVSTFSGAEQSVSRDFVYAATGETIIGSSVAYGGETFGTYFYMPLNGSYFALCNGENATSVTPSGSPSFAAASGFSDGTQALVLNGNGQYVDIPVDTSMAAGNFTFFARYYQTSSSRMGYLAATADCFIGIDNIGDVYSFWAGNNGWNIIESDGDTGRSSITHKLNQWVSLAYVHTAADNTYQMYVDGVLAKSVTRSSVIGSGQKLRIGTWGNGSFCFSGQIRDVRIYDRALSASELASM